MGSSLKEEREGELTRVMVPSDVCYCHSVLPGRAVHVEGKDLLPD